MAFIKEWNGRKPGDGVYFEEAEANALIKQGVAMDAVEWRAMNDAKKEHDKEMRAARSEAKEDTKKATKDKAPSAPKKNKMVEAPQKKKEEIKWRMRK